MEKSCPQCSAKFEITDEDLAFYEEVSPVISDKKYSFPAPTRCPDCRSKRRMTWRNERTIYKRTCDATGKPLVTPFSGDKPYKIYDNDYWFSDKWDPKQYGREYDFSRPFFEQFNDLIHDVPQLARSAAYLQNCEYVNQCGWSKDCYLTFEADGNDSCLYAVHLYNSRSCVDSLYVYDSELCFDCTDCWNCYALRYSQNCTNCSESWFLKNCIGCKFCIGCVNARNKEYWIFNEQKTKEEYEALVKELQGGSWSIIQSWKQKFKEFAGKFPNKCLQGEQNEDSAGDYLKNTQRCKECFDVCDSQDCKYTVESRNFKKVYDVTIFGANKGVEYCYEDHEIGDAVRNICFSDQVWTGSHDLLYCKLCPNGCANLFGCCGMQHAEYCILNKQYSKEEYEELVPKIIEHMKSTGEWGEFFPSAMSPFAYNETVAQEHYPLTKAEALEQGYKWKDDIDEPLQVEKIIRADQLPDKLDDTPDDILNWAIECQASGRPFRLVKQELDFYRQQRLPIPRYHFEERHQQRFELRNPRKLYDRKCDKCKKDMQTTYAPDRKETVYCEECYLKEVY